MTLKRDQSAAGRVAVSMVCAIGAFCLAPDTVQAQPSYELRTRFVHGWGEEATPSTSRS